MLSRSQSEASAGRIDVGLLVAFPCAATAAAAAVGALSVGTICCRHAIGGLALQRPLPYSLVAIALPLRRTNLLKSRSSVKIGPRSKIVVSTGSA